MLNFWSPELAPFLIPLTAVVIFFSLQVFLLVFAGIGFDFEPDVDVDVDLDVDVDVDLDADVDADIDADVDGGHGPNLAIQILHPLGLGKIPLSLLVQSFGLSWGLTGIAVSQVLLGFGPQGLWFLPWSASIGFVGACIGTRVVVRLFSPLFQTTGKADSHADLIGRTGRVTSLQVDAEYGEVCLEINGAPNYVVVRGEGDTLKRDDMVIVVGYDVDAQRPVVSRKEELLKQAVTSVEGA